MNDLLTDLYDRVSPDGFILIDDDAVDTLFDCCAPLELVDGYGCSWRNPQERGA
ncbi:MAG: hypothetical protein ACRDMZ_00335 [Solirubrobacteraceae bacterium]